MEGAQLCVTDADNAVVQFIECTPMKNYDRSNSKCQKTEFEFEFINQTSNFRTSFNNPILAIIVIAHIHFYAPNIEVPRESTACI